MAYTKRRLELWMTLLLMAGDLAARQLALHLHGLLRVVGHEVIIIHLCIPSTHYHQGNLQGGAWMTPRPVAGLHRVAAEADVVERHAADRERQPRGLGRAWPPAVESLRRRLV
jgi:hypothetical protein